MVDYRIVKHCRLCRERFVVDKGEAKIYLCKKCQSKNEGNRRLKK